ncbi:LysE family translocator [Ralstonia pseudosolanacearum]|uniref:Lysine exporter protein (LYSE/YGGA) n=1 Tax=Ralstonia solanacearum TaxID=305 RepID=A0A0S4U075_RALSL|nr:lysine transporter LysE [Ralstonia solanacearum]CUV15661.1 Lysine exporter protein (LYSE/YGGA) [Ralstonia solanacearum]
MLLVKAMAMGFFIAAPVGPIGMLCIQRSLSRGFRSGFATGIGAACADGIYGLLGALGIAGIATALPMLSVALKIGGGVFLVWLAWAVAREAPPTGHQAFDDASHTTVARDFLTTFALTLSNPMTILSFIGIFAALGPLSGSHDGPRWLTVSSMVSGVFVGSAVWWLCLSIAAATLRQTMPASFMRSLSRMSAIAIAVFGGIQMIAGVRSFIY